MFERRLKICLLLMFVVAFVLLARAMHVQVAQRDRWASMAADSLTLPRLLETTRGKILDRHGRTLAMDDGCIDACVDFRVIRAEPDELYIRDLAIRRLRDRLGPQYRAIPSSERLKLREQEQQKIKAQIRTMWAELARLSGKGEDEIARIRSDIESRVTFRKRVIWYHRYTRAMNQQNQNEKPAWYNRLIFGESSQETDVDVFEQPIAEETSPHVILRAIDSDTHAYLAKHLDDFPGLVIKGSTHRVYPFGDMAAHVIGHLGKVTREDLSASEESDDRRAYQPSDLIGRNGLEALLEPALRGSRGKEIYRSLDNQILESYPAIAGSDVRSTIDIELQQQIQKCFREAVIPAPKGSDVSPATVNMHGAAVAIEIATGNVLLMVSNPTFDLNTLDENYRNLVRDNFNAPLLHRATQAQLEPGSTVKPVVGLGAITDGAVGVNEGIECLGSPILNGIKWNYNKCWTVSKVPPGSELAIHHRIPSEAPHRGHDGNADGFLTLSDALCRSCNVYFVNCAHRLGRDRLSFWMSQFGLGRPSGIGIAETRGRLPIDYEGSQIDMTTWSAGIGQGQISASPLQMANIAATIARGGIWVRPRLVEDSIRTEPYRPGKASNLWDRIPERLDLQLSRAAVAAAQKGMFDVANDHAGTGVLALKSRGLIIAGKTGTAQAAPFRYRGKLPDGTEGWIYPEPSTFEKPNPQFPWYRGYDTDGKNLKHAWYIGYAPAENPKIAFAVLVEYGGGGGAVAGPIAAQLLDALVEHGYLPGQITARR